jgi:hypothetical protein
VKRRFCEITRILSLLSSTEKTDHAKSRACSCKKYEEEAKMIEKGLIITGSDAELLNRALSEVKTKAYEESEAQLDDTQALNALVSGFMSAESDRNEKEKIHSHFTRYVSALCSARLSLGKSGRTVARPSKRTQNMPRVDRDRSRERS